MRGIIQASFNHDASRVIVRPRDGDVAIWELSTGNPVPGDVTGGSDGYLMSGDAKLVVIGFKDGHCRVFNISDGGKWLATYDSLGENGPKGQLQVWEAADGKAVGKSIVAVNGVTGGFLGNNRILILPGCGEANVRALPSTKIAYTCAHMMRWTGPTPKSRLHSEPFALARREAAHDPARNKRPGTPPFFDAATLKPLD